MARLADNHRADDDAPPGAAVTVASSPAHRTPSRPLVFAHRGGRAIGPENTIAAFDAGMAAGADGLELDVRLSSDGQAMVIHDADLARTTSAAGLVACCTAAELAMVDAGARFECEGGFPWRGRGCGVPRLLDVLRRYDAIPIVIEMKDSGPDLARAVVNDIRAAAAAHRVCLAGFDDGAVAEARRLAPEIATSATREEVRWVLYRSWVRLPVGSRPPYRAFQLPERSGWLRVISPAFIRTVHRAGCPVQVWTVNEEADMRRLLAWGVDGLITDVPALAARVRDDWARGLTIAG